MCEYFHNLSITFMGMSIRNLIRKYTEQSTIAARPHICSKQSVASTSCSQIISDFNVLGLLKMHSNTTLEGEFIESGPGFLHFVLENTILRSESNTRVFFELDWYKTMFLLADFVCSIRILSNRFAAVEKPLYGLDLFKFACRKWREYTVQWNIHIFFYRELEADLCTVRKVKPSVVNWSWRKIAMSLPKLDSKMV